MSKKIMIIVILIAITIGIALYNLDIEKKNYDFSLKGQNSNFLVTLESHGTNIWYMWGGELQRASIGKKEVSIEFIGTDAILNSNPYITYEYDFSGSGVTGNRKGNGGRKLSTSISKNFLRELDDDYRVKVSINGIYDEIKLY